MGGEYKFRPKARLLLQLGDQLIKNENVALLELVKNSYDADSPCVRITFNNETIPKNGSIIIEDQGCGMDKEILEKVWLEPGSDYKESLFKNRIRTKKFNRLPLGEKGIGRFGAHKLGNKIELISRKEGNPEVVLKLNWNDFSGSEYLDKAFVTIIEREPEHFKGRKTGTKIIISDLKGEWTRGKVREVYRSINSLCSPFNTPDSFKISFKNNHPEWLEGLITSENFQENSLYYFNIVMEGNSIAKFLYKFTPFPSMKKIQPREITEKSQEIIKLKKMVEKDQTPIDLNQRKIGKICFEGYIFDRSPKILSLGIQDKKGLKEYLDTNGGIRVYRDGIRIYDYGEEGNDWLSLDIRRINIPTKRISNNIIISAVSLDRQSSEDLIEKTNREGFIDSEATTIFLKSILYSLNLVETLRNTDKDKVRTFYGPMSTEEPVVSDLNELITLIDKKISDEELKKDLKTYIKRVKADYVRISETLLKSAGAGLSLGIVIHEIDKIIDELKIVIAHEKSSERIRKLVNHLSKLVEGYSVLVRNTEKHKDDLKKHVEQAIFNIEFRLDSHKIKIIKKFLEFRGDSNITCARNMIIGTILNIFDNSIWWLEYDKVKDKKIFIDISHELAGHICLIIADNGPGFALPTDEITKPFVSGKPDGMGLGLHIAKEIMDAHKGQLIFPDKGEFSIPNEFENGALVVLAFKKESIK